MLKVAVAITVFYLLFRVCFVRDTFFKARRFYIMFSVLASLILPLIPISLTQEVSNNVAVRALSAPIVLISTELTEQVNTSSSFGWMEVLFFVMFVGTIFLTVRFVIHLIKVFRFIKQTEGKVYKGCKIIKIQEKGFSPFSFFRLIFLDGTKDDVTQSKIFTHEYVHASEYHSVDVMLMELYTIAFWWNPFAWLLRHEMKINHEYLADRGALKLGCLKKEYQYTLLNSITENTSISIINFFNVSQLNKRITMMNKKRTSLISSAKYLLIVPILGLLLVCNNMNAGIANLFASVDAEAVVEDLPEEQKNIIFKHFGKEVKYPVIDQEQENMGVVSFSFVIAKDGKIQDAKVLKGVTSRIDKEVLRVIKSLPALENYSADKDILFESSVLFKIQGSDKAGKFKNENAEIVVVGYGKSKK